mgnify:CR=1 FL=1
MSDYHRPPGTTTVSPEVLRRYEAAREAKGGVGVGNGARAAAARAVAALPLPFGLAKLQAYFLALLPKPLLVNSVDLDQGARVAWGLPGLQDVPVRDAVYASCALPGFFPPGQVGGRLCIDGGVVDNLPVSTASEFADIIIAVDVGSSDASQTTRAEGQGFATIYMRAATMMMHALQQFPLERWHGPPMVLVRPRLNDANWLSFTDTSLSIEQGYKAAMRALERFESYWERAGCVFPRRRVQIDVDADKCTGCGTCYRQCPVHAIDMIAEV